MVNQSSEDLTKSGRKKLWVAKRRIKAMAGLVDNEVQLRRILSDVRDSTMRREIFKLIQPHLKFEVDEGFQIEAGVWPALKQAARDLVIKVREDLKQQT